MCDSAHANVSERLSGHMGVTVARRDRFRGALLGLWLAPTAAAWLPFADVSASRSIAQMIASIPPGFELIRAFALNPNGFPHLLSARSNRQKLPCWMACLAVLLRYHDSRPRRLQWLEAQRIPLSALAAINGVPASVAIEQVARLGDLLEQALDGKVTALVASLSELKEQTAGEDDFGFDGLTDILLSALGHLPSYSLAVQTAVQKPAQGAEMACAAGLIVGALQGTVGLPVLWQLKGLSNPLLIGSETATACASGLNYSAVVDIAEGLFELWAGINGGRDGSFDCSFQAADLSSNESLHIR